MEIVFDWSFFGIVDRARENGGGAAHLLGGNCVDVEGSGPNLTGQPDTFLMTHAL